MREPIQPREVIEAPVEDEHEPKQDAGERLAATLEEHHRAFMARVRARQESGGLR